MDPKDLNLIEQAKTGDQQAYTELFTMNRRRVMAVIRKRLRANNDVEDLVQLTFLKAFLALQYFHGEAKFSTWLCKIATNETSTYLRRRGCNAVSLEDVGERKQPVQPVRWDEDKAAKLQQAERILAGLGQQQQEIVRLVCWLGWSHQEVVQELGVPKKAVYYALKQFRKKLKEDK